jgi:DNA-binding SARP family transcriptional activator
MDLRIQTLGPFAVYREGRLLTPQDWVTHKTQQLFKILLTHRGHTVLKDQLMEWLWPDLAPKNAANSLRVAVAHLRKALEPTLDDGTRSRWIISRPNGYLLHTEGIWLDVEAFLEKIKEAVYWRENERPDLALSAYRAAAELYRGDYLEEDRYEDWALSTREQLREAFYELRRDWADLLAEQQRYGEALALYQHLLGDYPIREEIWQRVMQCYAQSGQRDQALRAYEQCKAVLRRELEADPLPETQAIYEQIVHKDLPSSPFPQRKRRLSSHLRGEEGSKEVKQSPELQTLCELFAQDGPRLAILTGAGSSGLLEAFLAHAQAEGATVLRGRGSPLKQTLSFSVLLEALQGESPKTRNGLLPFKVPLRARALPVPSTCPAEYEYSRLLGGLCAELQAAIGSKKAILVLENLEYVDNASYHVLCHWALLAPHSDLLVVGTQKENFRSFWASELRELLQSQTISVHDGAPVLCHEDQNESSLETVLEWAYWLYTTMRRWGIDPSGWLKLSDHIQARLLCSNGQLAAGGHFFWHRFASPWPEEGEAWALSSYYYLLAQKKAYVPIAPG